MRDIQQCAPKSSAFNAAAYASLPLDTPFANALRHIFVGGRAPHLTFFLDYQSRKSPQAKWGAIVNLRGAPGTVSPSDDIEVVELQRPVEWNGVEIDVGEFASAVHLPGDRRAVVVAPDDVRLAVAVEVAD